MKRWMIALAWATLAMAGSGCAKQAAEAGAAATAPSDGAGMAASEVDEPNLAAVQVEKPACVKPAPENAVCTMDINICGHASMCDCGSGYVYDRAMGLCVLIIEGVGAAEPAALSDDDCVKPSTGKCTRDINACGQPSRCQCEDGYEWNAVAGKCIKVLG